MPRRDCVHTPNGQIYCIDWPEWHVKCAAKRCENRVLAAAIGEANTAREAERLMLAGGGEAEAKLWTRRDGLWYCPEHGDKE